MSTHRSARVLGGPRETPEHRELAKKVAELGRLEAQLVEQQSILKKLNAEIAEFYAQYVRIIKPRYAWLYELEAQIAEEMARQNPHDRQAQQRAADARAKARRNVVQPGSGSKRGGNSGPSESLKRRYRDAARGVHPDLASTDEERARRHRVMQDINRAYEAQDEDRLRKILNDWHDSPEAVLGDGPAVELIRTIRKIAQVERRLEIIAKEIAKVRTCYMYELRTKALDASAQGIDLLEQMASEIDEQIRLAEERLASTRRREPVERRYSADWARSKGIVRRRRASDGPDARTL